MKKIVIIGASYLQLPLVEKAKSMNIETHVFAWEEGAIAKSIADYFYPISIIEKEQILQECVKIKPDGICSIASDLAMHTVNYVANKLGLVGNSLKCTQISTNKYLMREALSKNGIKCPRFCVVKSNEEPNINSFKFPIIVKPTDRSGSRGVTKINSKQELKNAILKAKELSLSKEAIIEEFIEGNEISVETISINNKHYFLAITDKETTGSPNFVETAHHQPSKFCLSLKSEIQKITFKSLDALKIQNGASHSEMKITSSGEIYIIEIGARMGGDFIGSNLVKLSTGYDFVKGVINVALNNNEKPVLSMQKYSGVYFLYPQINGKVKSIIDNSDDYDFIVEKSIDVKIDEHVKTVAQSADRLGYYMYQNSKKVLQKDIIKIVVE